MLISPCACCVEGEAYYADFVTCLLKWRRGLLCTFLCVCGTPIVCWFVSLLLFPSRSMCGVYSETSIHPYNLHFHASLWFFIFFIFLKFIPHWFSNTLICKINKNAFPWWLLFQNRADTATDDYYLDFCDVRKTVIARPLRKWRKLSLVVFYKMVDSTWLIWNRCKQRLCCNGLDSVPNADAR